jgi:hypothetical protein
MYDQIQSFTTNMCFSYFTHNFNRNMLMPTVLFPFLNDTQVL